MDSGVHGAQLQEKTIIHYQSKSNSRTNQITTTANSSGSLHSSWEVCFKFIYIQDSMAKTKHMPAHLGVEVPLLYLHKRLAKAKIGLWTDVRRLRVECERSIQGLFQSVELWKMYTGKSSANQTAKITALWGWFEQTFWGGLANLQISGYLRYFGTLTSVSFMDKIDIPQSL